MTSSVESNTNTKQRDVADDSRASAGLGVARFVLVIVVAAAICRALWVLAPSSLHVKTAVVGTPTFQNFNYPRYFDAFYLIAIVFPLLAVVLYYFAARFGPFAGQQSTTRVLPVRAMVETARVNGERVTWSSLLFRLGLPALAVAIEASAVRSTNASGLSYVGLLAGLGYVVSVLVVALLVPRPPFAAVRDQDRSFWGRLGAVNSLGASVVVLLGGAVSATTNVTVASPAHVVHYDWLPWWLAAVFAVAVFFVVAVYLRKTTTAAAVFRLEGSVMVGVIGSVLVYLAVASLPGALGAFGGFDDAQYLAGAQLTFFHGLLPWKDVYLLHGMIEDVFDGVIGFAVLSHSRWGAVAGQSLIVYPITFCIYYLFVVYFSRRNRVIPLIAAIVIVAGETTAIMRFAYLPLTVMALDKVLRERSRRSCVLFGGLMVLEAVLTPEMALMALGLLATLVLFELSSREPSQSWMKALWRTGRVVSSGAAFGAVWIAYLVATGSFGAFIDYYRVFGSDHALWGAYAVQWSIRGDLRATIWFALPIILELATIWRIVGRLRARRRLSTRDWSLLAAASFAVLYYQKGLDRPDTSHFAEVFTVCMPLVMLWGIEGLEAAEIVFRRFGRWLASLDSRAQRARHATAWLADRQAPMGVVCAAIVLGLLPQVFTTIDQVPGRMHASSPVDAQNSLLGYTVPGAVNLQEIDNLGRIIDAYTPPGGPVFDFANEPGIVYYLLNRVPGSRFFHVEEAETPHAQDEVISELANARPNLVIYTDTDFGLPTVDGIVGPVRNYMVSQYLLDHYAPFADDDGQIVLIRDDLVHRVAPVTSLHLPGVVKGYRGLYLSGAFSCNWGDVPNFLVAPNPPASYVNVPVSGGSLDNSVITGWAVDAHRRGPVHRVIAVSDGRVIATARPDIYRLDIEDFFAAQKGWTQTDAASVVNAGFQLQVKLRPRQPVQVYAINGDGSATRIWPAPAPAPNLGHGLKSRVHATEVTTQDGQKHQLDTGAWLSGWLNTFQTQVERVYTLRIDPKINLAGFRYLAISSSSALGTATFNLGDIPEDVGRDIAFSSLPQAGNRLTVPVGSCLAWHGYSGTLQLIESGTSVVSQVRLGR